MSTATRPFPAGQLRVSDADRDLAIAELSDHFETGRLSHDEFGLPLAESQPGGPVPAASATRPAPRGR
jgi:hypothetical protein